MQNSQLPAKWYVPFATNDSAKVEIPVTTSDPTRASQSLGFPPLTMQPPESGGVPPQGEDFNGAMNQVARIVWWMMAGGALPFDSTFASNANINGYPSGARVAAADLQGIWINTADNNTVNPDTVGTNWLPGPAYGNTAVTGLTNANVTLTPAQAIKPRITLTGTLTGNVQIIVPNWVKEWLFVNNTGGAFTVTVKTAAGAGVVVQQGSNAVVTCDGTNCDFANRSGATAAQFDSSLLYATNGFVQRALGNFSDERVISSTTTLTAADAGRLIVGSGTVNLPLASSVRLGTVVAFYCNQPAATLTVQRQGSDIIDTPGGGTSFAFGTGDWAFFTSNAVQTWRMISGTKAMGNSAAFGKVLSANGYQKLPTGWIIQWGTLNISAGSVASGNVTLPVTYPTAQVFCSFPSNELNNNASFGTAPAAGNRPIIGTAFPTSTSAFAWDARTTDGSSIGTSGTIRMNWISIGY